MATAVDIINMKLQENKGGYPNFEPRVLTYQNIKDGFRTYPLEHFAITCLDKAFETCVCIAEIIARLHDQGGGGVDCTPENLLIKIGTGTNETLAGFKSLNPHSLERDKDDVLAYGTHILGPILGGAVGWSLEDPLNKEPWRKPVKDLKLAIHVSELYKRCIGPEEKRPTMRVVLDELRETIEAYGNIIFHQRRVNEYWQENRMKK